MYYKNVSFSVKTFHGVTFKPGETKEVDKYINSKFMVLVSEDECKKVAVKQPEKPDVKETSTENAPQSNVKQQKPSSEKPKKNDQQKESTQLKEDPVVESVASEVIEQVNN